MFIIYVKEAPEKLSGYSKIVSVLKKRDTDIAIEYLKTLTDRYPDKLVSMMYEENNHE